MASHAHRRGDSMSVAKLGLIGTIGAAIIGAVTTIVVGVLDHNTGGDVSKPPPPTTTITPTLSQVSDRGSFNDVEISATGDVTISGSAEKDVNEVFVTIGPKPSGGNWVGQSPVVNHQWKADVPTDSPWKNYTISAYYYTPPGGAAPAAPAGRLVSETSSQSALKFTFQGTEPTTPPPPPPSDQIVNCAKQFGASCFTGPGFGPPSVYQSNQ